MTDDDRPTIRALVCWFSPAFGICGEGEVSDDVPPEEDWPKVKTLEEAVDFARAGAAVLIDPADEAELATWERAQRWRQYQGRKSGWPGR